MSFSLLPSVRSASAWAATAVLLTGCGGGGDGDSGPAAPAPASAQPGTASAKVAAPANGKVAWNIQTPATFSLTNSAGAAVTGALTCTSGSAAALAVAADCSSLKGLRLGPQTITVSGGGVSAQVSVKVIPQAQPIGTGPYARTYNLAVTPDGKVLAWGANHSGGTLGQGKTPQQLASLALPTTVKAPSGVDALTGIVAAAAGSNTGYALTEDGEVYSWGSGSYGTLGRPYTGDGDTLSGKVTSPTGGGTLQKIVSIAVGDSNVIALADDGTVFYWGSSQASGQVSGPDAKAPITIAGLPGPVAAVSAGLSWNAALLADGRLMTWGFNSSGGNLGRGAISTTAARTPGFVLDKNTSLPVTGLVSVSAGWTHGLALNGAGQVYGWGANENGEVGQGDAPNNRPDQFSAVLVKAPGGAAAWSGVKMVAAGAGHSLALDGDGKVFSWGYAQAGELGDGANHPRVNSSSLPAPVVNLAGIGQLSGAVAVATGYDHSMALGSDGSLSIWGRDGGTGNLGQGSTPIQANDSSKNSYVPLTVKNEAGTAPLSLGPVGYWPNLIRRGNF